MGTKKIITVFGATGAQGGGLVRSILEDRDGPFAVRAVTRDTKSDAARALGPDWDIEIAELHHRLKVDAPSGTALALGEAAARGRGIDLATHSDRGRDGITGARVEGQIGFASLRGGSAAGDHMVLLASEGERIELWHRAENRSIFARGALRGAQWLAGRKPGRYVMADVLGI